ncbi:MAG: type I-U CRISPR-associated protein Cas5/Cas6 [Rhodobacteraceae bacterium]|nr:type I-U CRISPR-associated protein Cas5/Cas6 [Paracoccaceae bacterium]
MSRGLAITVHFLAGRYHGAGAWPPTPARLFQALAAGAARGKSLPDAARQALEWLEEQAAPVVAAPAARRAQAVTRFVPNNDFDGTKSTGKLKNEGYADAVAATRVARKDQPWLFDAAVPLVYLWKVESTPPEGLLAMVDDLYRLGCGTDPAFASAELLEPDACTARLDAHPGVLFRPGPGSDSAVPRRGTLSSLEKRHAAFGSRFKTEGRIRTFRQPPKPRVASLSYAPAPRRFLYRIRSLNPEDGGSFRPIPLIRAATLADQMIKQTADRLEGALPEHAAMVNHLLRGKGKVRPDPHKRIRVIPLPSSGHPEVDLSIRRLLVDIPPDCPIDIGDLDWAFITLRPIDPLTGAVSDWCLERVGNPDSDSILRHLKGSSMVWRTLTPVVGPVHRHGRTGTERRNAAEAFAQGVRQALRHAGVREKPTEIRIQTEPFQRRGSRADQFEVPVRPGGKPISIRRMAHVELRFHKPVKGLVLIGDGRFRGLGLMEPVREHQNVWLFSVSGSAPVMPEVLARATRRAVMARVASELGRDKLPAFFTGHEADGAPVRRGGRSHIGFLVDPAARHLLIAAPQALNHTDPDNEQARHTRTLSRALSGLQRVVAGAHGAFDLCALAVDASPLLHTGRVWESVTDWQPDRHGKGDPVSWIPDDVRRACSARGLPLPAGINILMVAKGRRGGIRARLRLSFAGQMNGPLALGRTAMCGGGSFRAVN